MANLAQVNLRNRLLRSLSPMVFARLQPLLRPSQATLRQTLVKAGDPLRDLHFPETAIVSVLSDGVEARVEIGLVGREGLAGATPLLLGDDRTPFTHIVQMTGTVLTIDGTALLAEMDRSEALRWLLLRYIQYQFVQTGHTAYTNARARTEIRLARWLLMYQDRIDGDIIMITQEFMSYMLGVERPGVTGALTMLGKNGLIETLRGGVRITNRTGLISLAGDCYGYPEAEYNRLIGEA